MDRSPVSSIPEAHLDPIQRGTIIYEWKGMMCLKNPFDLALYLRLLWQVKPATLIEIGSYSGGSAAWFSDMTGSMGLETRIVSVDLTPPSLSWPRVEFLAGSSEALGETLTDELMKALPRPFLVIDDASHRYEHCLANLRFFDKWLAPGEYICVEDGIVDSFNVQDRYGGGPNRAIREFFEECGDNYEIDASYCDYYGHNVTWNTNGYIRKRSKKYQPVTAKARQAGIGSARIEAIEVVSTLAPQPPAPDYRFSLRLRVHDKLSGMRATLQILDDDGAELCRAENSSVAAGAWEKPQLVANLYGAPPPGVYGALAELRTADGELVDTSFARFFTHAAAEANNGGLRLQFED